MEKNLQDFCLLSDVIRKDKREFMGVVLFQIIQIIDSWISMSVLKKLLGDLGNLHFGKDADGYRIKLEMNTGQFILLPD